MSEASAQIPNNQRDQNDLDIGTHAAYIFESNADKQRKLFALCRNIVDIKNGGLLYIAGKQGVKGIRLSLIDTGFDVSSYQRSDQLMIVDSEEWFLTSGRAPQFKSLDELESMFRKAASDTLDAGYSYLTVISETDMLVRKGFLEKYKEFDLLLSRKIRSLRATCVCAFDKRELQAAGVADPASSVSDSHSILI